MRLFLSTHAGHSPMQVHKNFPFYHVLTNCIVFWEDTQFLLINPKIALLIATLTTGPLLQSTAYFEIWKQSSQCFGPTPIIARQKL